MLPPWSGVLEASLHLPRPAESASDSKQQSHSGLGLGMQAAVRSCDRTDADSPSLLVCPDNRSARWRLPQGGAGEVHRQQKLGVNVGLLPVQRRVFAHSGGLLRMLDCRGEAGRPHSMPHTPMPGRASPRPLSLRAPWLLSLGVRLRETAADAGQMR